MSLNKDLFSQKNKYWESDYSRFSPHQKDWKLYCGDATTILQKLGDCLFDCIITSPPYFWLRDYGNEGQIGLESTVEEYVDSLVTVMYETQRVLKKQGVLFLNLGDTYYSGKGESQGDDKKNKLRRFGLRAVDKSGGLGIGLKPKSLIGIPWRVALKMQTTGWILRSAIIWNRKFSLPESVHDRPKRSYEFIFMFVKNRKYFFDNNPLSAFPEEDIWEITSRAKGRKEINTAPFPDDLVVKCLDVGCPSHGSVLDPFAGSGTTLRVANKMGRSATGIELNSQFCEYIVKSLKKEEPNVSIS